MSVDIILVKFGRDQYWRKTLEWARKAGNVLTWDNTEDNIGLVAARLKLIAQSTADYLLLMDYDFTHIRVDLEAMQAGYPMAQPGTGGHGWSVAIKYPCNFMLFHREAYEAAGGLRDCFHTAYADWDLIKRLPMVMQHNPSIVSHVGSDTTKHKREIWKSDRAVYDSLW